MPPPTFAEWSKHDEASTCAVRWAGRVWVEHGDAQYLFIEDSLSSATPEEVKAAALVTRAQCGYATTTAYSDSVWATPMLCFPDDDADASASDEDGPAPAHAGSNTCAGGADTAQPDSGRSADEASDSDDDDRLPPPPISRDELEASMYVSIFPDSVLALPEPEAVPPAPCEKRAREHGAADGGGAKKARITFSFGAPAPLTCAAQQPREQAALGGRSGCSV